MSIFIEWLNINRLSLNEDKFKCTIIHVPRKETQTLTLTLILSHINYCITVWGYKDSQLLRIQKRQFE